MISVIVEGGTDAPYLRKLCQHAEVSINEPIVVRRGKGAIDPDLPKWANMAKHSPYVIVRDLDQDAGCAPAWLAAHAPENAGRWLVIRLAVRAVESWFLADTGTVAACLHIDPSNVPVDPDAVANPKDAIVALARKSRSDTIRKQVAPGPKDSRRIGPQYEQRLIEWSERWSVEAAMARSASLRGAHTAIRRLEQDYKRFLAGTEK